MSPDETFWLDVLGAAMLLFILTGVIMFVITPKAGRFEYLELGVMLCLIFLVELISNIAWYSVGANNNLGYNILNIVNLPLIVLLYRRRAHWENKIVSLVIVPYVLFCLVNLFFVQGPFIFNYYTYTLASVCFILISVTYFYILIKELPTESITKLPMFWINSAILIYYSGTFFLYLSADYLVNVLKNNMIASWLIHNSLGLVYYAVIWYGLWLVRAEHLNKVKSPST